MSEARVPELRFPEFDEDWETSDLGELNTTISDGNYGELYPTVDQFVSEGVPFIRANNLKNGRVVWNDMRFIHPSTHSVLKSGHLKLGDVLVTTRGEIGTVARVTEEFVGSNINAQICLLREIEKCRQDFLFFSLLLSESKSQFASLKTGSALKQLPRKNLKKLKLGIPTLPEQKKIAAFLSAVDEKLAAVEAQLARWRDYKRGMMQALFTQRLRFKANDGSDFPDWVASEFGVVVERNPRKAPSEITFDYPCVEMDCLVSDCGTVVRVHEFGNQKSNKSYFHSGDVLFGKLRPYLRKFAHPSFKGACSTEIWVLNGKGLRNDYLFQLVQTPSFVAAANKTSGSKMPRADWGMMKDFPIRVPPLPEQQKIADALSAIDAKIEALIDRLDATREFKRGLLQKMFV